MHPSVAVTLNDLAMTLRRAGQSARAAPLHAESLDILDQLLGAIHPTTVTCPAIEAGLREARQRAFPACLDSAILRGYS